MECLFLTMDSSIQGHQRSRLVRLRFEPFCSQFNFQAVVSNGATFMPNTFTMQEFVRMSLDEHLENLEGGESLGEPVIYTVRKGCAA